jgi:flavin-dependent dehydrogenase
MSEMRDFDVAVVGASVAGCAAARLFAQAGARVALIEKHSDPAAYKVMCTHAILPPAAPTIERLGLAPLLYARGAVRTSAEVWTPYGGWLKLPDGKSLGWGVTRRTFDPTLRELAVNTAGVELLGGWSPKRVPSTSPPTLVLEDRKRHRLQIRSRLLVGADGRDSTVARLAEVPGRVRPHNRFFYFAYWRGVRPKTDSIRVWLMDPVGGVAHFPNEDDISMVVASFERARVPEVRADPQSNYLRRISEVPDPLDLSGAERVSKIMGKLEMPNVIRLRSRPGLAFVGDAALATDPLFGVGISFALLSAEWLVEVTRDALTQHDDLERALRRYRRQMLLRLGPHHWHCASYSSGRRLNAAERLLIRRAGADPVVRRGFAEFFTRERGPVALANPRAVGRLLFPRHVTAPARPARGTSQSQPDPALKEVA